MDARIHIHLHVADLERSEEFYRKFLGAAPVKEKQGYVKFLPSFVPLNLAISQGASNVSDDAVSHMGMQLDSTQQVMEHLARVKAAALPVREEMGVDCCHANQDKFWVRDPDGVEWEVYHLNYDIEEEKKPAPQAMTACCAVKA
jgi:catechol 2,3-dioxygenase-like lactoylglutathione lyase family enzyme